MGRKIRPYAATVPAKNERTASPAPISAAKLPLKRSRPLALIRNRTAAERPAKEPSAGRSIQRVGPRLRESEGHSPSSCCRKGTATQIHAANRAIPSSCGSEYSSPQDNARLRDCFNPTSNKILGVSTTPVKTDQNSTRSTRSHNEVISQYRKLIRSSTEIRTHTIIKTQLCQLPLYKDLES